MRGAPKASNNWHTEDAFKCHQLWLYYCVTYPHFLKITINTETFWNNQIKISKEQRDPKPPKCLSVCLLVIESLPFTHTQKKKPGEKVCPSGIMVNFKLTQKQSATKVETPVSIRSTHKCKCFQFTHKMQKFPLLRFDWNCTCNGLSIMAMITVITFTMLVCWICCHSGTFN